MEIHALDRALERYGLLLTTRDMLAISKEIATGLWGKTHTTRSDCEYHLGSVRGQLVRVCWIPSRCMIATFLPLSDARNVRVIS